jgi:hypothetical protein
MFFMLTTKNRGYREEDLECVEDYKMPVKKSLMSLATAGFFWSLYVKDQESFKPLYSEEEAFSGMEKKLNLKNQWSENIFCPEMYLEKERSSPKKRNSQSYNYNYSSLREAQRVTPTNEADNILHLLENSNFDLNEFGNLFPTFFEGIMNENIAMDNRTNSMDNRINPREGLEKNTLFSRKNISRKNKIDSLIRECFKSYDGNMVMTQFLVEYMVKNYKFFARGFYKRDTNSFCRNFLKAFIKLIINIRFMYNSAYSLCSSLKYSTNNTSENTKNLHFLSVLCVENINLLVVRAKIFSKFFDKRSGNVFLSFVNRSSHILFQAQIELLKCCEDTRSCIDRIDFDLLSSTHIQDYLRSIEQKRKRILIFEK